MVSTAEVAACGVFVTYFGLIAALFTVIARDLLRRAKTRSTPAPKAHVFGALTLASFAHTWFYMFKFMAWSFRDYEASAGGIATRTLLQRISRWLLATSLFEQAWASVCFGTVNWWWSQQLCLYTVGAWTVFLTIEGQKHQVKRVWAYMLLGQLVAISVASNLFYLALVLSPPTPSPARQTRRAHALLWIPILISLGTVALSPFTSTETGTFLPNLLLMHALIVVPLVVSPIGTTIPLRTLYALAALSSILLHTCATYLAFPGTDDAHSRNVAASAMIITFARDTWTTLHGHPAQSSIGWDVIWTSVSLVVWTAAELSTARALFTLLATPFVSVGALAPYTYTSAVGTRAQEKRE
ncbi:hypothetical protein C8F01DRAFT_121904 [Mycena amicta]|nr:hypothetical protein C8F01DRAFT_121904 [Mycena amicta]